MLLFLLFCELSQPLLLYNTFLDNPKEDFLYKRRRQGLSEDFLEETSKNDLLCDLDESLLIQNFTTVDFGLPPSNVEERNRMAVAAEEIRADVGLFFLQNIDKLNDDQKLAFNVFKTKIDDNEGGIIFIDAPGGTGKTFLLNLILDYVRSNNGIALATSSGIAATLLKNG